MSLREVILDHHSLENNIILRTFKFYKVAQVKKLLDIVYEKVYLMLGLMR